MPDITQPQKISGDRPQPKKRKALFAFLTAVLIIVLALLLLCIFPGGHEVLGVVLPVPKGKPVVTNLNPLVFQKISPPSGGGSSLIFFPTGGTGVNVPTDLPSPPATDLNANGSNGPVQISSGSTALLSWTTANDPTSCVASGDWSGSKNPAGGSETSGVLASGSYTYNLTCSNPVGSTEDTVVVNVAPPSIVDVCPNLPGDQAVVPSWLVLQNGQCVTSGGPGGGGGGGGEPESQCVVSDKKAVLPIYVYGNPSILSIPGKAQKILQPGVPYKENGDESEWPSYQVTAGSDQKVTVDAEVGAIIGGTCNAIKAEATITDNDNPVAGPFELTGPSAEDKISYGWSGSVTVNAKKDEPHDFKLIVRTICVEEPTGFGPSAGTSVVRTSGANIYKAKINAKAPGCPAPQVSACPVTVNSEKQATFAQAILLNLAGGQIAQAEELNTSLSFSGGKLVSGKFPAVEIKGKTYINAEVNPSCGTGGCSNPTILFIDKSTGRTIKTFANSLNGGLIIDQSRGLIEVRLSPNCSESVSYSIKVGTISIADPFVNVTASETVPTHVSTYQLILPRQGVVSSQSRIVSKLLQISASPFNPLLNLIPENLRTLVIKSILFPEQSVPTFLIKKEIVEVIKEVPMPVLVPAPQPAPTPTGGVVPPALLKACYPELTGRDNSAGTLNLKFVGIGAVKYEASIEGFSKDGTLNYRRIIPFGEGTLVIENFKFPENSVTAQVKAICDSKPSDIVLDVPSPAVVTGSGSTGGPVPAPLVITTSSLPNGTVGSAYSQTLTRTGGTAPFTWSISSGSLPSGLSLSEAGVLSGTPDTGPLEYNFTVKVTDSAPVALTDSKSLRITTEGS